MEVGRNEREEKTEKSFRKMSIIQWRGVARLVNGEENQWESMSNHPVRESIRRGEQEKETAAESEKREKARDEETDNKWDDAPHDGLPQASAATWNYTTKNRWGGGGGGGGCSLKHQDWLIILSEKSRIQQGVARLPSDTRIHHSLSKATASIIKPNVEQLTSTQAQAVRCCAKANELIHKRVSLIKDVGH